MDNVSPLYPSGNGPFIITVVAILIGSSILPTAFSPKSYTAMAASGPFGLIFALGNYLTSQAAALGGFTGTGLRYAVKNAWLLLFFALTFQGSVLLNDYDNSIYQSIDMGMTKYILPAYRNTGLPIANFARITYDTGICWVDLALMARSVAITDTVKVLVDCSSQDWQDVVNTTFEFIANTLAIPVYFIQADGKEAFQSIPAFYALAIAINSTQPSFRCMCEELNFLYDIIFDTLTDPNLSYGLDAALNSVAYYPLNITVQAIVEAFGQSSAAYICDQTDVMEQIVCVQHRPPYFIPLRESLCNFTDFTALFLENTVDNVISQFLDYDGHLLVFNKMLSAGSCLSLHFLMDFLDLVSRIDMVFNARVQYMRHWAFNQLIDVAHRFAQGVGEFFFGFNNYYTDQVGVIGENTFLIAGNSLNIFKDFAVAVFYTIYDTSSLIQFFQTFNSDQFSVPYYNIKGAVFNLTDAIDDRFSAAVMEVFTTAEDFFKIPYNIVVLLAQDPDISVVEEFFITDLPPLTDLVAIDIHAVFVTLANFIRQFDDTCEFGVYQPPYILPLQVTNPDTVCQLADIVETLGQFIRSMWIQISSTIYQLEYNIVHGIPITGYGPFLQDYSDWLHVEMQIVYSNLIDSMSAFIGSWFQDIQCPCVNNQCSSGNEGIISTNVRDNVRLFVRAFVDASAGTLYHGAVFIVDSLLAAVDLVGSATPGDLSQLLCVIIQGDTDFIGRVVYIFKTLADFVDCLLGTNGFHINLFTGTLYYVIFDPLNSSSARNEICDVIASAIQAIQFVFGVLTGGFTYIGDLITQGATIVGNTIINAVNVVFNQLNTTVISRMNDALNTVLGGLRSLVCFINRVIGIFACLSSITVNINNTPFTIDIPQFGTPPINIDLQIFSFTIPAIPIDIPGFTINIPLPDVSSITGAINCLTSNLNNFNSAGCANTCGPTGISGGIYPSFCTGTIVIPQVPDVPPISKRSETTGIYYNETGEIVQSNDTLVAAVYNNYTMVFCGRYYNLSVDPTLSINLRGYFVQQYIQCALSAQTMFTVNYMIFQNETKDWLNPLSLTSLGYAAISAFSLGKKLYYPIAYEVICYGSYLESKLKFNQSYTMTNYCTTWDEYYTSKNLSSRFSYKVGDFLQQLRNAFNERSSNGTEYGFSDLFTSVWNTLTAVYNKIFVTQNGVNSSLYNSLLASVTAYSNETYQNLTVKRFVVEHVIPLMNQTTVKRNAHNFNSVYNRTSTQISLAFRNVMSSVHTFLQPKTQRTARNRKVISNMIAVVSNIYKEYSYKYKLFNDPLAEADYIANRDERSLFALSKIKEGDITDVQSVYMAWKRATPIGRDKIVRVMETHIEASRKRQTLPPNPFANDTICGIPVPGGGTTCINCTILATLLDDFLSRVLECVSVSQTSLNILETRYFAPFTQLIPNPFRRMNSQTSGVFEAWVTEHLGGNFTDMVANHGVIRKESSGPQTGPSFGILVTPTESVSNLLNGWVTSLAASVFDIEFSFINILNGIKNYLVADTTSLGNTLYDWVDNFVSIPPTMNCQTLSERGIGIGNLLLTTSLVSLYMVAIIAILARVNSTLLMSFTPVILMWPGIILVINYGVSPLQLPAVPFCLADDIYEILEMGNVDCVPITSVLNGITTPVCPGASTDYQREFIKCSESPYYFNNPWRILYFVLDYVWPSFMNTLRTSSNPLFSTFRSINGMAEMMQFDYPPGQPTPPFVSCAVSRVYNAATFGVYLGALAALSGVSALSLVLIALFIGSFTYALGLTCMWIAMMINGDGYGEQPGTAKDYQSYIIDNLKGSKTYNERPVQEIETKTGISFSGAKKTSKEETKKIIRPLLNSHVRSKKKKKH